MMSPCEIYVPEASADTATAKLYCSCTATFLLCCNRQKCASDIRSPEDAAANMHALCARTRPHGAAHVLCSFWCSLNNPWTQKQNDALRAYFLIQHPLSLSVSLSLRSWCTATHFWKSRSLVVSKHFRNPESLDFFCSWSSAPRQWEAKGSDRKSRRLVHKHPAINCEAKQVLAATGPYFEVCHFNCEAFRSWALPQGQSINLVAPTWH